MKRFWKFVFALFAMCTALPVYGAEKPKKYLELGAAPVEPGRMVNWAAGECILRLEHEELATITYARGGISSGWLRRGTAVVVDRNGVAAWVYNCGNHIIEPQNWKPKGKLECGPSFRADTGGGQGVTERPQYLPKEENGGKWYLVDSEKPANVAPKKLARKDPNKKWYFVAAGILALGVAGAYCTSSPDCMGSGGGGSGNPPDPGGGPAPDPPN